MFQPPHTQAPWRTNELVPAEVSQHIVLPWLSLALIQALQGDDITAVSEFTMASMGIYASTNAAWGASAGYDAHFFALQPPSYEQVIKEINQVQVNTTSNNNATGAANARCTVTSSTQTDFPEEIISSSPGISVKSNLPALHECETPSGI